MRTKLHKLPEQCWIIRASLSNFRSVRYHVCTNKVRLQASKLFLSWFVPPSSLNFCFLPSFFPCCFLPLDTDRTCHEDIYNPTLSISMHHNFQPQVALVPAPKCMFCTNRGLGQSVDCPAQTMDPPFVQKSLDCLRKLWIHALRNT